MSNHMHLVASARDGFVMSTIIRDFKKFTAKAIIEAIQNDPKSRREWMLYRFEYNAKFLNCNSKYKFWKDGFHPIELSSIYLMEQKLGYIHMNPVKDGIVEQPEHYLYSSARNYSGTKGLLEIQMIG